MQIDTKLLPQYHDTQVDRGGMNMNVLEAIKNRRSIRKYKDTPINDNDLNDLLEAARWAPSWANSQCCRLVVVKDAAIRNKLAGTVRPGNRGVAAIQQAPVVIVACAELGKSGYYKGEAATDKGDWYMFDVALAMDNISLVAHERGLGTLHVGLFDPKAAAQVIGVPEGAALIEMMVVGYPDEEAKAPPRKELSEIVMYERYG